MMRIMTGMAHALVAIALLAVALAGCGDSHALVRYSPSAAPLPVCAHAGRAAPLPPPMPRSFPLPPHTAIVRVTNLHPGVAVSGFIPSTSVDATAKDLVNGLSSAGYESVEAEVDTHRDAESLFAGNGYVGQWKITRMQRCKALTLD